MLFLKTSHVLRKYPLSRPYSINTDKFDFDKHVHKLTTDNKEFFKANKGPVYSLDEDVLDQNIKPIERESTILTKALKKVLMKRRLKEENMVEKYNAKVKATKVKPLSPQIGVFDPEKAEQIMNKLKIGIDTKKKAMEAFSGKIEYLHSFTVDAFQSFLDDKEKIRRTVKPYAKIPQVCFIGRSNVGKSSLINALLKKKSNLLKVSQMPGRTQGLTMVMVDQTFIIVDMPGYGFANVPMKKKKLIQDLSNHYLMSALPVYVFVLIDSRRGIDQGDKDLMDFLEDKKLPYQILLTKVDKVKPSEVEALEKKIHNFAKKRFYALPEPMFTSSKDRIGVEELRHQIYLASGVEERKLLAK